MDSSKQECAVFEQAKQPLMQQCLEKEDEKEVDIIEPIVQVNKEESLNNDNLNMDNKYEFSTVNTNNGGDALSNVNVPMKNDFNENATLKSESTSGGKSLFEKAKDTLSYLKDTAMNMKDTAYQITSDLLKTTYKYSDPNKAQIIGMGKLQFEAIKLTLEKNLYLKGMKTKEWREERNEQWKSEEKLNEEFNDQGSFKQEQQFEQQPLAQTQAQVETLTPYQDTFQQSAITPNQPLGAVQGSYQEVNKEEFVKAPDALFQQTLINDDRSDELQYLKQDKNEVHVLPSIKVQDKPVIIEKEVSYEKPVEIKQTIIHQEKPIIVEQPIIKQKFEHYRDNTQFESNQEKVITESNLNNNNNNNNENEALFNLRKNRIDAFNDTTPIYQNEKENIKLDTEYREQPTVINEKQIIYQQPVEIEQKFVEKITPVVHENVTLNKEHVYEKQAPQLYTDNVQQIQQGDQFFSKDGGVGVTNTNVNTNVNNNNNNTGLSSNLDARNDANFVAGQEQRTL
jgi:hypothetical protein